MLIGLDVAILSIIDRDVIAIRLLTHIGPGRFMEMQQINDFFGMVLGVGIRSPRRRSRTTTRMILVFLQDPEHFRFGSIGQFEGLWTSIVLLLCSCSSSSIVSIVLVRIAIVLVRLLMKSQGTQTFGGSPLLLLYMLLLLLCQDGYRPQQPPECAHIRPQ